MNAILEMIMTKWYIYLLFFSTLVENLAIIVIDRSSHEFLFTKRVCWDRALLAIKDLLCARFVHISVNHCYIMVL